jgi:hypothetical protein
MTRKSILITAVAILGLTFITIAQNVPSYVPTNGLVGWWPFTGNANDESGNGNNGTVNGATLTTDRFGQNQRAYSFNGITNDIGVSLSQEIDTFMTLSFWIKTNNSSKTVISFNDVNGIYVDNDGIVYLNDNIGDYGIIPSQTSINNNQWRNVIVLTRINYFANNISGPMTFGINGQIFVDGILKYEVTPTNCQGQPFFDNLIGTAINFGSGGAGLNFTNTLTYFGGQLDDIGIWNRALNQQEITALYNSCQLSINSQPSNQTININSNAQFVVGSSDPNASYQWQTDLGVGFQNLNSVVQYSGTTSNTLTVSNVTMSNNNQPFRCIVSSGSCSDTSNVATLMVNNNAGINDISQSNFFTVYPNPAQHVVHLKVDEKLIGSEFQISDNSGKVLINGKITEENTKIQMNNLVSGIYLLGVGANLKQTIKIVKD